MILDRLPDLSKPLEIYFLDIGEDGTLYLQCRLIVWPQEVLSKHGCSTGMGTCGFSCASVAECQPYARPCGCSEVCGMSQERGSVRWAEVMGK